MSDCPHRDDVGPWVLRALGGPDATAFAAHLETCDACRAEVAELQGVADILPMAAPQVVPPPALKSRIMAVVNAEAQLLQASGSGADRVAPPPARRERRRRLAGLRPLPALGLASVLLALLVAGVVLLSGGDDTTTKRGFGPMGSEVALQITGDQAELDLKGMPATPEGRTYQVWLVSGNDKPVPSTLFKVPAGGDGNVDVGIGQSVDDVDQVLITAEPEGGSRQPTSDPIAGATLS